MRAIEIAAPGGPDVLRMTERPDPVPAAGELLLKVVAAGVNRPDVFQRLGQYPVPPGASDIPGLEVAGVVMAGDADALRTAGVQLGDRVCALLAGGGYAELCVVPAALCLPVPDGLTDVEAASLPETFFTVWSNVFDRGRLRSGETLLVQGGSSGIGVTAIQCARAAGATVIATVGSDAKANACKVLGAHHVINYRTADFVDEVQRLTGGRGVDVVLDMVAGSYVQRELRCMADDGRLVIIAMLGGKEAALDVALMMRRRLMITGSMLRTRSVEFKAAIAKALREQVWPWIAAGTVRPVIHQVFPMADAAAAHATMEDGHHIGKLVLQW